MAKTLGIIEGSSYAAVIAATDRATKAADVQVRRYEKVGEHAVATILEGDTADVQVALEAAKNGGNGHPDGQLTTVLLATVRSTLLGAFRLPR